MSDSGEPGPSSFDFLSRRRFIQIGLGAGAALLALGAGGFALRGRATGPRGLRILSAHDHRTLSTLARAMIPSGGAFEMGAEDRELAKSFDDFLVDEPDEVVRDLRRALVLVEFGPLLFAGRLSTFSHLDPAEAERHWESWATSRLLLRRQIAIAFRKFLMLVFYDHPDVWPSIGYPPPTFMG